MNLKEYMDSLAAELQAKCPARKVTRIYRARNMISEEHLAAGVYTVLSDGIAGHRPRKPRAGKQRVVILFQVKVREADPSSMVEDAEFSAYEEIISWLDSRACDDLAIKDWAQSQQLEAPYGGCAFEFERMIS